MAPNLSYVNLWYGFMFMRLLNSFSYGQEILLSSGSKSVDEGSEFLWGVSTAAYQIEGATSEDGKSMNIWDTFIAIPGKIHNGDTANIADDSYHKFEEDIKLVQAMGVKSYRLSIAWARILPTSSREVNPLGIAYYNKLLDLLTAANIQPLITIYHWDLPQYLHDEYGGWLSPNIEKDFTRYSEVCFREFGDRVKLWTTMNEPWSFSYLGYGVGSFAPGRCSNRSMCPEGDTVTEPYIVAHNVLNAHSAAVELYRQQYQPTQNGRIGMVLNLDWAEPYTSSEADVAAAQRRREFSLGWFADPIYFGKYPPSMVKAVGSRLPTFTEEQRKRLTGSVDFFALNHYTTKYFMNSESSGEGWAEDQQTKESKYDINGNLIGPQGESSWLNVVPWGIYKLLMWVSHRYTINGVRPLILITENGFDVFNETSIPLEDALHDVDRISYYSQYFEEIKRAVRHGVIVKGYFAWSLLDNFEWADGYSCRFGLHYVDYNDPSLPRYAKDSSKWYADYSSKHPAGFTEDNDWITWQAEASSSMIVTNQDKNNGVRTWSEYFSGIMKSIGII